jgi:hypothetical protein
MRGQLLEILQHCQATNSVFVLTGDKSWFRLEDQHSGLSDASRDEVPENLVATMDTKMCMILMISSVSGIHGRLTLTKGMKCNSQYFRQYVIPNIQQNFCSSSRRKILNGILLHLGNA